MGLDLIILDPLSFLRYLQAPWILLFFSIVKIQSSNFLEFWNYLIYRHSDLYMLLSILRNLLRMNMCVCVRARVRRLRNHDSPFDFNEFHISLDPLQSAGVEILEFPIPISRVENNIPRKGRRLRRLARSRDPFTTCLLSAVSLWRLPLTSGPKPFKREPNGETEHRRRRRRASSL